MVVKNALCNQIADIDIVEMLLFLFYGKLKLQYNDLLNLLKSINHSDV